MFQPPPAHPSPPIEPALQTPLASQNKHRTFEERHLTVPRSARYAMLGSIEAELTDVWIVCHGHGQLARRFLSRFLPLEREDRLFVAPEALSRYYLNPPQGGPHPPDTPVGASWMTYEDRDAEIGDYVRYLDLVHDEIFSVVERASVRLWVLGFSQGVATAARWMARGKVEADRAVFYAGLLPPELDAAGAARLAARSPLTVVLGTNDEFARPELVGQQEARLRELRVPYNTIRFDGGHEIKPDVLNQLAESARL
jgi:predicted esterase